MEPRILHFDEPLSTLDPAIISEVLEVMLELAEEGMTLIVVIHEAGFARRAVNQNQMVFMDQGEIVETGLSEVFLNPRNWHVVSNSCGRSSNRDASVRFYRRVP